MSTTQDEYCDKIFTLFEKHFPGKYQRNYVENLLKANVGREEIVYQQFLEQFGDVAPVVEDSVLLSPASLDGYDTSASRGSVVIHDESSVLEAAENEAKSKNDNNNDRRGKQKHRKGGLSSLLGTDGGPGSPNKQSNNKLKAGGQNNKSPQRKSKHAQDLDSFEKLLSNIEKGVLAKPKVGKNTKSNGKAPRGSASSANSKNGSKSDASSKNSKNSKNKESKRGSIRNSKSHVSGASGTLESRKDGKKDASKKETKKDASKKETKKESKKENKKDSKKDATTAGAAGAAGAGTGGGGGTGAGASSKKETKKDGKKGSSHAKRASRASRNKMKSSSKIGDLEEDKFVAVAADGLGHDGDMKLPQSETEATGDEVIAESIQDTFAQAIKQMQRNEKDADAATNGANTGVDAVGGVVATGNEFEYSAVNVVLRVRPVNSMEMDHETRLLFKVEFDMDDKDWAVFSRERAVLLEQHEKQEIDLAAWTVEQVCEWLEKNQLEGYKARCRRKKVNGEYLVDIPRYMEKKPLEVDNRDNFVVAFKSHDQSHKYEFDAVFVPQDDNNAVFDRLGPNLVNDLICGYNVTIFAYGQTGTGKTFTMFGDDYDYGVGAGGVSSNGVSGYNSLMSSNVNSDNEESGAEDNYNIGAPPAQAIPSRPAPMAAAELLEQRDSNSLGIIPRTLIMLFDEFDKSKEIAFFNVQIAIMEIYCEKLRDLIRPRMKLTLRYVGQNSKVDNLTYLDINSAEEALKVIDKSKKHRVTAETKQNLTSSRSHCIIVVKIDCNLTNGTQQSSVLTFGDLAGSEKISKTGAKNQRLREAKKIVQSLFALKKTIRALASQQPFVPYQDSVLTKLLRDSIGGNSKTTIVVTASPHEYNRSETLSSLRFAEMAKKIQNDASVNRLLSRDEMESQIHALQEQLQYLRKQKAKKSRFTSTDFRVLQRQLNEAVTKAEEFQSKYLNCSIQLLVKTQYIQEVENIIEKKNKQLRGLRDSFVEIRSIVQHDQLYGKNGTKSKTNEKILKALDKIDTSDMDQKHQKIELQDLKSDDEKADFEFDESSSDDGE